MLESDTTSKRILEIYMKDVSSLFKQTKHPSDLSDYYHLYNSNNILNVIYWWEYFREINFHEIQGDIVECGVGRGRSLITLASINRLISNYYGVEKRRIFALDSFEGFPDPTPFDTSPRNPKRGDWSNSPNNQFEYSPDAIKKILKKAEVDEDILFIKGFFDKTTKNIATQSIAILHLDGDLYESIRDPLNNLWNKMSIGGIIVLDDYLFESAEDESFPGARKAVMDFLEENKSFEYLKSIRGTPYLKRIAD